MEAETQRRAPRHATYQILLDPSDEMHPINRMLASMDPDFELPATFTLRDPLDGKVIDDIEITGLTATFENGGFALHGTISPRVQATGRLNTEADDNGVIGTMQFKPFETE